MDQEMVRAVQKTARKGDGGDAEVDIVAQLRITEEGRVTTALRLKWQETSLVRTNPMYVSP